jgi:hypothetical protein
VLLGCHFSCRWPFSWERCGDFRRAPTSLHDEPRDGDGAEHRRNCYADRCQALAEPAMRCRRLAEMKGTTRELFGLMPGRHKAEGMTCRIGEDTRAVGRRLMAELRGA